MTSSNGYKYAFWMLLTTVVAFQMIITFIAHARHEESHQLLQSTGRLRHSAPPVASHGSTAKRPADAHAQQKVAGFKQADKPLDKLNRQVWQEVLSSSPKIVLLHNFATKDE